MTWWTLTFLENTRAWTSLFTQAQTNLADHLFMAWSTVKPARTRIYRTVRGKTIWCGYKYIWNTPNIVEQNQSGDTLEHTFGLISLQPTHHVWYYLFAIAGPYGQPCQGPLIHVPPPELPMPSARITHTIAQAVPHAIATTLTFDTVRWDDYALYDPAFPTRLTIPVGALYALGASVDFTFMVNSACELYIYKNTVDQLAHHSHFVGPNGWEGAELHVHTIWALQPGDILTVVVRHTSGAPEQISKVAGTSPEFWIAQIGAYPIPPP